MSQKSNPNRYRDRAAPYRDKPKWLKYFWFIFAGVIIFLICITAYSQALALSATPEDHPRLSSSMEVPTFKIRIVVTCSPKSVILIPLKETHKEFERSSWTENGEQKLVFVGSKDGAEIAIQIVAHASCAFVSWGNNKK